jgi:hypothetical protein
MQIIIIQITTPKKGFINIKSLYLKHFKHLIFCLYVYNFRTIQTAPGSTSTLSNNNNNNLFAPSFTEKNNLNFTSYQRRIPNTATTFGVRPDHRFLVYNNLNIIFYYIH